MFNSYFSELESDQIVSKEKTFSFTLKVVTIVLIYFLIKFNLKYHYYRENVFMIPGFIAVLSSKFILQKLLQNTFKALFGFIISVFYMTGLLIFLTGGLRAPGAMWICIMPFISGTVLGKRGFVPGIVFTIGIFAIYYIAGVFQFVPFPYPDMELYFKETRTNLFLFSAFALVMVSNYFKTEEYNKSKILDEKTKNENLLKILFNDLANPIQNIRMILKKLSSSRDTSEYMHGVTQLDEVSIRMVETLDQVRKMKALDDGKVNLEIKPILIREALKKSQQLLIDQITLKKIKMNVLNDPSDQTVIMVDEVYFILQILCNIISNSIKYSEQGSEIFINWSNTGDATQIEIRDQGIGMSQSIVDHLFSAERRTSRRGTFGEVGTGYGMPLVKSFTQQFKGSVSVYSVEKTATSKNHGTTVTLKFPKV